jgi:hypothetical protein
MAATLGPATELDSKALGWLQDSDEPGIRFQARRDLLGERVDADLSEILAGPMVQRLLAGQAKDGGFGGHPYKKWDGAHWRLVSLVELGLPPGEPRSLAAAETVLGWLTGRGHRAGIPTIEGRTRRCASQEGNALAVSVRLGMADDPRVRLLADSLVEWQWADGGWNCDRRPDVTHSSLNESLPPVWGLSEYARATGDVSVAQAARRACVFFLEHRVFRSHTTGAVGNEKWLDSPYPAYWHYNFTQGLTILGRAGALPDKRATDALRMLRERQQQDGTWSPTGKPYWRRSGEYQDPANWPSSGPSPLLTLNALRVVSAQS